MNKLGQVEEIFGVLPKLSDKAKDFVFKGAKEGKFSPKQLNFLQKAYDAHGDMKTSKLGKFLGAMREMPTGPMGNELLQGVGVAGRAGLTGAYMARNKITLGEKLTKQQVVGFFKKRFNLNKNNSGFFTNMAKGLLTKFKK